MRSRAAVRAQAAHPPEAGFVLIEAVAAVALIAVCAGAALAASLVVTQATNHALPAAALTSTAQNVLTDLRAATAYDPGELATLAGRSVTFRAIEPGPAGSPLRVTIVASVARSGRSDTYIGSVTARADNGSVVTVEATLVQEAPAPGEVLPVSSPNPDHIWAPDGATPEPIQL